MYGLCELRGASDQRHKTPRAQQSREWEDGRLEIRFAGRTSSCGLVATPKVGLARRTHVRTTPFAAVAVPEQHSRRGG